MVNSLFSSVRRASRARAPCQLMMRPLCLALALLTHGAGAQTLAQVEFDPRFLGLPPSQTPDLTRFRRGNVLEAGTYRYDIFLNRSWLGRENIRVLDDAPDGEPYFCFTQAQVQQWGLNLGALPNSELVREQLEGDVGCVDVHALVPDFQATSVIADMALQLSIPQAYLSRRARGYVSPDNWEQGVTAGFVNYNLSAFKSHYRGFESQHSVFGSFNAGFNLGAWRLRHNASYSHDSASGSRYRNLSTYVQRDIASWRSQLTLGQSHTPSNVFNSVPYTGVQINSDDRMLPDSLRGFAPVIRGVADGNSRVSVFQNGNQIYETTVPSGPFVIDDLYNTGFAGDLEVVITQADGQTRRFTVAYTAVAQLLRPGQSRYSVTAGRYRDDNLSRTPYFTQATYQRGLSNLVSAYGGAILAEDYLSGQLGLAFNAGLGAIAVDVTHAHARDLPRSWLNNGGSSSGQSYRVSYSKMLAASQTRITMAAYRFSSSGYLSLSDFARARDSSGWSNTGLYEFGNGFAQRHRFQLSVNQPLGDYGSLYLSGNTQDYWNSSQRRSTTYQLGYGKGFSWGSMSLDVSRFNGSFREGETQATLSLNIRLGRQGGPTLSTSMMRSSQGSSAVTASLHGSAGERRQLSYSVYNSYRDDDVGSSNNAGGSLQYAGRYAQLGASASASSHGMRQGSLSLSGSVVAYPGGVSLVREQGSTFAVLRAPGAAGASVNGNNGSLIGENGYGVTGNLVPYRNNALSINPNGSSLDVEIIGSTRRVAPTAGAIVMVEYETRQGRAQLLDVSMADGSWPPMGADVRDEQGRSLAVVGQRGRIFLRGLDEPAELRMVWGPGDASQCRLDYKPAQAPAKGAPFARQQVQCSPVL